MKYLVDTETLRLLREHAAGDYMARGCDGYGDCEDCAHPNDCELKDEDLLKAVMAKPPEADPVIKKAECLDKALKQIEDECRKSCDEENRAACWGGEPDPECYTGHIRRLLMGKK